MYLFAAVVEQEFTAMSAGQSGVTVTNVIKHQVVEGWFGGWASGAVHQRRDRVRDACGKGYLHKNQRIVEHRRMEKCKAEPLFAESGSEVLPTPNLVHRFILNDALKYRGGGVPINGAEFEKTAVKPRNKLMLTIYIDTY